MSTVKKRILLTIYRSVVTIGVCGLLTGSIYAMPANAMQPRAAEEESTSANKNEEGTWEIEPPSDDGDIVPVENEKRYPDYFDDMVEEYIDKVNAEFESIGDHGFAFCFVTDMHIEHNSDYTPYIIRDIYEATPLKYVINGGDMYDRDETKEGALAKIHRCMSGFDYLVTPMFVTLGNHDLNDNANKAHADQYLTMEEFYDAAMVQMEGYVTYYDRDNEKYNYYYYDQNNNTYLVCIQTGLGKLDREHTELNDHDVERLKERLPTLDGNIIIFTHLLNDWKGEFQHVGTWRLLLRAINESGCADRVKLVVSGHTHLDQSFDSEGVLHVITGSNTYKKREETIGTTDELAFDTYFVDYESGTVKTLRFGRGEDRTFDILE